MPLAPSTAEAGTTIAVTADTPPPAPLPGRTNSGGFKTTEGTIYISNPVRSKSSKRLRALITFAPRKSHFDTTNESSGMNEFRGFFSLFWISMFLFTVRTYIRSFETNGYALSLDFATMFSRDAVTLALSDAVLVFGTAICVPFIKVITRGWINYYWTGAIIQHVFQILVLTIAVTWTFNRQWPWVQSGFFTLHSLVMIMKMYSYVSVNGYLKFVHTQSQLILGQLHTLADNTPGGYDKAVADAHARRAELALATSTPLSENAPSVSTGQVTPLEIHATKQGMTTAYAEPATAAALRKRLFAVSTGVDVSMPATDANTFGGAAPPTSHYIDAGTSTASSRPTSPEPRGPPALHCLVDHPDEQLASLAREFSELDTELTSTGPLYVRWPENITLRNFAVYQLTPTLVYELEYPRTERIRPLYVFEKTVAFFGTFALLYTVTETFIIPLTPTRDQSFFRSLLDLALPFMIAYLLLFYIIFECICNGFAELSYFADRQFYEDWLRASNQPKPYRWNSTSWDEFSRKWNKPVHTFLLRHVYASSIASYRLSRGRAMFATFVLSAAAHELVMAVVTKKIRMYLFLLQLIQIPMIAMSRTPFIKRNKLLGNVVFWLGLYAGFPLLCVAYVAY